MTTVSVQRTIQAPIDVVYRAITDIANLPATAPMIVRTEFLSEITAGVGTRFRETRVMNGKKMPTDLEITEMVENEHARMVADSHGTTWDTLFSVVETGEGTVLELTMDARANALLPRIMNPIMKRLFRRGLDKHIDAVKEYCEREGTRGLRD